MDAIRSSRKRNHPSSPLFGRLTRSRSQLSLHRNRSGHIRSDPVPRPEKPYSEPLRFRARGTRPRSSEDVFLVCKKTKRDDCELSRTQLAKDLRARRVYSPQSSVDAPSELRDNAFLNGTSVDSGLADRKINDSGLGFESSPGDVTTNTVTGATESSDVGLSCNAAGNTDSSDEVAKKLDHKKYGENNGGDCSKKIDDLGEELVLTTTLGANMCSDSKVNGDEGKREEKVRENSPFTGIAKENAEMFSQKDSQGNGSVLKSNSVPRPRFRGTLFKAPGSVSYRRLFPYLMDIIAIGVDSGTPKVRHCQTDDKGADGQKFQLPLSSQHQEASKYEPKTNSCTMCDTNGSNMTYSHNLRESPLGLDVKQVTNESLTAPSDPTANLHGVKNVVNDLHKDNFKQYSICKNVIDHAKATNLSGWASEQFGALDEEFILTTPPDAEIHDYSKVNVDKLESIPQDVYHVKPLDLARNVQENANEGCFPKHDKMKSSLKIKSVPRAHLHRKLFKTPGSVSFRRLLPFIMDLTKDDPGTKKFGHQTHHLKDEVDMSQLTSSSQSEEASIDEHKVDFRSKHGMVESNALENNILVNPSDELSHANKPKLTPSEDLPTLSMQLNTTEVVCECLSDLSVSEHVEKVVIGSQDECLSESNFDTSLLSQSEEASIDEPKIDFGSNHGTIKSNALENNVLVNPSDDLSDGNEPKLTPSQDLPKLSMHLDTKEVVHECLSDLLVNEHTEEVLIGSKEECLSESKFNPCCAMDFGCVENAVNGACNDGSKQVQNRITRQHNFQSPPNDQNMLDTNGDISNLTFEHHSVKENGFNVDHDERNQIVSLEKCEYVSRCPPPESQNLCQFGPNMLDVEQDGTSSHGISRSYDAVVANHVGISNDKLPSDILLGKSDRAGHGGERAGSVLKGIVYDSKTSSKGINDKNACAGEIEDGPEYMTTLVLNRCPRIKLLKHTGSLNYKRLLPFFLNNLKDNSSSNRRGTPISDSNGSVRIEQYTHNSDTLQQAGLYASDINNDSSSSRSQIPEFQSSHDSCKVIQLLDEQIAFNGLCKLDDSTDPSMSVHRIDVPIAPLGPNNEVITGEKAATCALSESSNYSEVEGNSSFLISSNEEQPLEINECSQSLSQQKVLEQLKVPAGVSKKGILKRNPRGCRGLCTCLNCVSFHLHAERAFEFSRNQLLDAEEVAQDLMKELSHLRYMLERSTDNVNNNYAFDGNQVKEACRKAFATEQLAKHRLSQMNEELNIRCRTTNLQPPRVRFAEHVEAKVIQPGR